MKLLRIIAWVGLIAIASWDLAQYFRVKAVAPDFQIIKLELSCHDEGQKMLADNADTYVGNRTVLKEALINTKIDFLFIVCYVACFFIVSYHEMQKQKGDFFNSLLRLNLLLCFIAGAFDVAENLILLFDFHHFTYDKVFVSTYWISLFKWVLIGWMFLSIVIARITRFFNQ